MLGSPLLRFGQETFDVSDPDGPVELESLAVKLTRMRTDIPENARKRQLLANCLQSFAKPPCTSKLNIEVSIDSERASRLAVGRPFATTPLENPVCELDHMHSHGGRRIGLGSVPTSTSILGLVTNA